MDFDGSTYIPEFDRARLNAQEARVYEAMKHGAERSLSEIHQDILASTGHHDPEASISARLRGLRKKGCQVLRRRCGDPKAGFWVYRVLVLQAVAS